MQNRRAHWLEVRVSAGAVDSGVELSLEWHGMAAAGDLEIRGVGLPVNDNVVERSGILSHGRQYAGNALDRTQVGTGERIAALYRCILRAVFLPRPQSPAGMNHSHRLGIREVGFKSQRLSRGGLVHNQVLNVEHERKLTWG